MGNVHDKLNTTFDFDLIQEGRTLAFFNIIPSVCFWKELNGMVWGKMGIACDVSRPSAGWYFAEAVS